MGELDERRWAVVSERGCEAASVTYEEAVRLVRRLQDEKIHGRCIVTAEAAARLNGRPPTAQASPTAPAKRARPRRKPTRS